MSKLSGAPELEDLKSGEASPLVCFICGEPTRSGAQWMGHEGTISLCPQCLPVWCGQMLGDAIADSPWAMNQGDLYTDCAKVLLRVEATMWQTLVLHLQREKKSRSLAP